MTSKIAQLSIPMYILGSFPYFNISPAFLTERNLDQSLAKNDKIDLVHEKFYEEAMPTYMEFSKKIKEDGSPLSALNIFMDNLKALRKKYDEENPENMFFEDET